ncbi:hypothetical protein PIB30_023485 [Stylosanthes scabra]|uniref:Uncharacterized protein n=1 Tax=Stylosanthes scabra TaxID=79078 RepID=A0ABU6SAZ0_9FABA|nr:hypothetical protein [Stylosanthes scabra]
MWQEAPPFRWRQEFHNLPPPPSPPPPPVFSSPSSFEFDTEAEFEPEPEPILIKTFFKFQRHHSHADFAEALSHGIVPSPLTLIQTETMDINLRDITNTIRDQALPPVIRSESNIMLSFAVVYLTAAPAPRQYIVRKVGRTMCNAERIIDDYLILVITWMWQFAFRGEEEDTP